MENQAGIKRNDQTHTVIEPSEIRTGRVCELGTHLAATAGARSQPRLNDDVCAAGLGVDDLDVDQAWAQAEELEVVSDDWWVRQEEGHGITK